MRQPRPRQSALHEVLAFSSQLRARPDGGPMHDNQISGVHDMTTLRTHPYWGIRPEELHEARLRAHAERTKVRRQIITALSKWRLWRAESTAAAEPFLPPAI